MKYMKIGVVADAAEEAQEMLKKLCGLYDVMDISDEPEVDVDTIVALGGDGFMLHTLHKFMSKHVPIFGINCGTIGFLMNKSSDIDLIERIETSGTTTIHPLRMVASLQDGSTVESLAINEVSLLRKTGQAAKIRISVDDVVHMEEIICDGMIVSTPAGSSAYNCSVGGPILPLKSDLLALTPISPFRPRRWKGAILPNRSTVRLDILKSHKRPVNAVADFNEADDVVSVQISIDRSVEIQLLFDVGHSLEERIIREQFSG